MWKKSACLMVMAVAGAANADTLIYNCPIPSDPLEAGLLRPKLDTMYSGHTGMYLRGTGYLSWQLRNGTVSNATGSVSSFAAGYIFHDGFPVCQIADWQMYRENCFETQSDQGVTQGGSLGNAPGGCIGSSAGVFPTLPSCMPAICNATFLRNGYATVCADFAEVSTAGVLLMGESFAGVEVQTHTPQMTDWHHYDNAYAVGLDLDAFHAGGDYNWAGTISGDPQNPPYFEVYWNVMGQGALYSCTSGTPPTGAILTTSYNKTRHFGVQIAMYYTTPTGTVVNRGVVAAHQLPNGSIEIKRLGIAANATYTNTDGDYTVSSTFNMPATIGAGSISTTSRTFDFPGDMDNDGHINHGDRIAIHALSGATLSSANYDAQADINLDGVIDDADVRALPPEQFNCAGDFNHDGALNNSDQVDFINAYFAHSVLADIGVQGGLTGSDGLFNNNDFVAFNNVFFAWTSGCQ